MTRRNRILAINDYGRINEQLGKTLKSGKQGKSRISMRVDAQPVLFDLSDTTLLKDVATRYEQAIRKKLAEGGPPVSESTAKQREVQEKSYWDGKRWAVHRFSGGKLKQTPPKPSWRNSFKHSGRLEQSIQARFVRKSGEWIINVAGNRLRRETFGTEQEYRNFLNKLLQHIPNMDARRYIKSSEYHRNMSRWIEHSVKVLDKNASLKAARRRMFVNAARAALKLAI